MEGRVEQSGQQGCCLVEERKEVGLVAEKEDVGHEEQGVQGVQEAEQKDEKEERRLPYIRVVGKYA